MDPALQTRITVPPADLDALSFCETTPGALADWVMALPMANTPEAAAQVRRATAELARLRVDPETRLALLEQLRPILHYLCARLDRTAAASASKADDLPRLAQRLQINLCLGYQALLQDALGDLGGEAEPRRATRELLSLALHRALSDLSRTLLRTLQLYVQPGRRLWLELNQLYLLAERLGVTDAPVEDHENHAHTVTTPANAYLRSLLLASCSPHQLRHRELAETFNSLEDWARLVTLEPGGSQALFVVDLESEQGPQHAHLLEAPVHPRSLQTAALVRQLRARLAGEPCELRILDGMSDGQLRHLADAWGTMQPRSHRRATTAGQIRVAVGLRATHYLLAGGTEFADLLNHPEAPPIPELDPFRRRLPEGGSWEVFATDAVDTSASGYHIHWPRRLPALLQTGELLALREAADHHWRIALVRWIRQSRTGAAMGVELLSPRGDPVAARVIQKIGGPTSYARALLLPALPGIGEPATLLTPGLPFQAGQKVHVLRRGVRSTLLLQQCVQQTESVNRFTYRVLAGYLASQIAGESMSHL